MSTIGSIVGILGIVYTFQHFPGFLHPCRVEGTNLGTLPLQTPNNGNGWSLSHVICIGLERKAQNCQALTLHSSQSLVDLCDHEFSLPLVNSDYRLNNLKAVAVIVANLVDSLNVFRKTGATKTGAGMEEFRPYATV